MLYLPPILDKAILQICINKCWLMLDKKSISMSLNQLYSHNQKEYYLPISECLMGFNREHFDQSMISILMKPHFKFRSCILKKRCGKFQRFAFKNFIFHLNCTKTKSLGQTCSDIVILVDSIEELYFCTKKQQNRQSIYLYF